MSTVDDLLHSFPDLTQSMVRDVFSSVEGDHDRAQQILVRFATSEPNEDEIKRKLRELENFQTLGTEVVLKVLKESRWDVEKAIIPLFGLLEEKEKEERRKKYEEERLRRAADAKRQANTFLKDLFVAVPEEQIQKILDENDGDVDVTTDQLVDFLRKEDERQRKEKEEEKLRKEKQRKRDALAIRFSKSEEQVDDILENLNWDIQAAIRQLLKLEQDQKYHRFAKLYSFRRPEEIRHALEINDYDEPKTMKYIDDKIELEKLEAQKKQKEEMERRELELRMEERKRQENSEEVEKNVSEKRRLEEQEAERKREEERKKQEQRRREEDEKRERQKLWDYSVLIHFEIEDEVKIQFEIEDPDRVIKQEFIKHIRDGTTVGPGLNGRVPTNEMQKHANKRISDNPVDNALVGPYETKVSPVQDSTNQNQYTNQSVVQLVATPAHTDYGGTITLLWEHTAEPTVNDWIGFYVEGALPKEFVTYEWVSTKKGTLTFKAPPVSGNYYFRYYVNKSYISWGTSNIVKVGPSFKLTPTIIDSTEVKIKVEQLEGQACPNAWVAMYEPDQDNKNYYTYSYVSSNSELSFKIPKVGIWEFRLFPQKTYYVSESCKVNLNGSDKINLSIVNNQAVISYKVVTVDPYYDNVWIGIFNQNETDNRQWRRYKYVYSGEGELFVKAMQTPGTYEARLFARSSNTVLCRSNTVTIPPSNKI